MVGQQTGKQVATEVVSSEIKWQVKKQIYPVTLFLHIHNLSILTLQAFTIIAVLNSLRFSLGVLPFAVKALADANVSFKRYKVGDSCFICFIFSSPGELIV